MRLPSTSRTGRPEIDSRRSGKARPGPRSIRPWARRTGPQTGEGAGNERGQARAMINTITATPAAIQIHCFLLKPPAMGSD